MEHKAIFQEQVALTPKDMRVKIESIDDVLLKKLRQRLEGRCSRNGFVVPGTLKVLSRSMGVLEKGRFTGSILFYIHAEGTVLNPPDGVLLEGEVTRKNKMGIYVSYQLTTEENEGIDAIKIIVPRDLHIGNEEYDAVEIGQNVSVEIKKSRFQVNDPFILSVGLYRETVKGSSATNRKNLLNPLPTDETKEEVPDLEEAEVTSEADTDLQEEEGGEESNAEESNAEESVADEAEDIEESLEEVPAL